MNKKTYYILKVKGKAKIPDYVQVRDEGFTLVGYFRPGRGSEKLTDTQLSAVIESLMETIPVGKITKIEV